MKKKSKHFWIAIVLSMKSDRSVGQSQVSRQAQRLLLSGNKPGRITANRFIRVNDCIWWRRWWYSTRVILCFQEKQHSTSVQHVNKGEDSRSLSSCRPATRTLSLRWMIVSSKERKKGTEVVLDLLRHKRTRQVSMLHVERELMLRESCGTDEQWWNAQRGTIVSS